jgi:hypothetical protein
MRRLESSLVKSPTIGCGIVDRIDGPSAFIDRNHIQRVNVWGKIEGTVHETTNKVFVCDTRRTQRLERRIPFVIR